MRGEIWRPWPPRLLLVLLLSALAAAEPQSPGNGRRHRALQGEVFVPVPAASPSPAANPPLRVKVDPAHPPACGDTNPPDSTCSYVMVSTREQRAGCAERAVPPSELGPPLTSAPPGLQAKGLCQEGWVHDYYYCAASCRRCKQTVVVNVGSGGGGFSSGGGRAGALSAPRVAAAAVKGHGSGAAKGKSQGKGQATQQQQQQPQRGAMGSGHSEKAQPKAKAKGAAGPSTKLSAAAAHPTAAAKATGGAAHKGSGALKGGKPAKAGRKMPA